MFNILIANQKGGVGKSVVADELAFSFERSGIPINFYDLDGQGGTLHKSVEREDALVSIIDTPGTLSKQLGGWIASADLVVIPTRTTSRDIEPLWRVKTIAKNSGKPIIYVFNGWNRYRASRDFMSWFRGACGDEDMLAYALPQSEMFVQAAAAKMSVVAYARRGSAVVRATLELCNAVRESAGFDPEDI